MMTYAIKSFVWLHYLLWLWWHIRLHYIHDDIYDNIIIFIFCSGMIFCGYDGRRAYITFMMTYAMTSLYWAFVATWYSIATMTYAMTSLCWSSMASFSNFQCFLFIHCVFFLESLGTWSRCSVFAKQLKLSTGEDIN